MAAAAWKQGGRRSLAISHRSNDRLAAPPDWSRPIDGRDCHQAAAKAIKSLQCLQCIRMRRRRGLKYPPARD